MRRAGLGGCCRSAGSGGWFDPSVNFAFTCLSVFALSGEVRASEFRSALCRWFPDPAIPQREFPVQIGLIQGGHTTPGSPGFHRKIRRPVLPQREFPVQIGLIQGGYTTPGIRDFAGKSGDQYGQVRKPPAFLREIRSETHLSKPLLTAKRFVGN